MELRFGNKTQSSNVNKAIHVKQQKPIKKYSEVVRRSQETSGSIKKGQEAAESVKKFPETSEIFRKL